MHEVFCITWHKMSWKPSVADQYTAFLTLPDCNMLPIWRRTPLIKMSSHCQAGTSNRQSSTFVDCTCKLRHLDTAHITQFLNWLHNLNVRILRRHNAISRSHKFPDCVEHIYGTYAHKYWVIMWGWIFFVFLQKVWNFCIVNYSPFIKLSHAQS